MKVRYTPEALRDLQRISASIMEKFNNETVEKRVLKNITGAIRGLEVFPYKGGRSTGGSWGSGGLPIYIQ